MRIARWAVMLTVAFSLAQPSWSQGKPKLSLDDFFNYVDIGSVRLSPNGDMVVVSTRRADWAQERFRHDLWLIRVGSAPVLLTSDGEDSDPQWSPDGRWISFLSERPVPWTKATPGDDDKPKSITHLYVISATGGEALPVTRGEESVHSYSWTRDSKSLYFSTREPWSKAKRESYKKEWKDVQQYREADRGDVIARISLADAIARAEAITPYTEATESADAQPDKAVPEKKDVNRDKETAETPGTVILAHVPLLASDLAVSHNGQKIAFASYPPHHRQERVEDREVFVMEANGGQPKQVTKNEALESDLTWTNDDRQLLFSTRTSGVEGKYEQRQGRIYALDSETGKTTRWAADFKGVAGRFDVAQDGSLVSAGQLGTETQLYSQRNATSVFTKAAGWPGTYESFSIAEHSPRVAFVYSAFGKPAEVYLADSLSSLNNAKPIASFNKLFADRELPLGRAYQWKSDDGAAVEGVLIYPPGKFGQKNLPMFTLIHGGPEDADGNAFSANWYDWAALAATNGWLVFRPNYRGSTGYGDDFELQISPNIVSKPGRDILTGVDALVKDGIADPDKLTVGGYSYGGYMTNWLITQTPRFKAAVTGAGAVEHIANWGNDDLTYDDAWYLGGTPWEAAKNYNDEAAIFQINKVKTPTHIVGGSVDIRVYIGEQYLLERALAKLDVPHTLLVFPGEGHGLSVNPWHGKIKVREELKWLEKYCPPTAGTTTAAGK
jgi:dipeptidyl aminopeptidase/acylaminoacyl peptidase